METVNRILQEKITARIAPNKAVLIFGARRVGKTVMMRKIVDNYSGRTMMLNGEDYDTLALLENRSIANYRHLLDGIDLLAIDEAQNIPQIGSILKLIVDEIPGISVLASGSSSFDLLNKTGEPLVGRSTQFLLTPFSQREIAQTETALETRQNLEARLIYGSYPEVVMMENYERKTDYLRDIVGAYLLKDILAIDGLKNSSKMRDLLRLIAFQLGSEVSYEELGKQLGMSKTTVEKYLDLLEKVFVIYRLGAYSRNLRKEVIQKLASGTSTTTAFAMPLSGLSHRWPFGRMSVRCGRTTSSESGAKRTSMRDCTGSSISGAPTTNRKST